MGSTRHGDKFCNPLNQTKLYCLKNIQLLFSPFRFLQSALIGRKNSFIGHITIELGDHFKRGMHTQNRYAGIDGIDIPVCHEFCNGSAASLIDFAEFRHLVRNVILIQQIAEAGNELGVRVARAAAALALRHVSDWQAWDASDEMDDRGWRADNTFEKLDQYIGQVLAAARQAGKEELATGLQVAGRNLHNELIRAEEFGISPEAQRKFIQKLTPLLENFLDANEKLKNTEIAEVTNNWQLEADPAGEQYLGEIFNENDLKQVETFNRAPGELPFRFPKEVSYEHIAAHLAATVKEQRQKRSEEGYSGPLHVLNELHNRLKQMADDNGEPKSVLAPGNKPRPIRKLQRAIKEVINTSINLADGYTKHDDPKSQELMNESVEALKNLENAFGHFKIQNADLAEDIDFDDQIMSKLEEFSYLNYSKAPLLDSYFLPEDKKKLLESQKEQGLRHDDDPVIEPKENIIENQPVKKPVTEEKMLPDEKEAAPQPTNATADRKGRTWLGYMEAHKINPLPQVAHPSANRIGTALKFGQHSATTYPTAGKLCDLAYLNR